MFASLDTVKRVPGRLNKSNFIFVFQEFIQICSLIIPVERLGYKTQKQEAHGPHHSPPWAKQKIIQEGWLKWKSPLSPLAFEQTWIPSFHPSFVPSLVKFGLVLENKVFLCLQCIFCYFTIIPLWKRAWLFIWKQLNSRKLTHITHQFEQSKRLYKKVG